APECADEDVAADVVRPREMAVRKGRSVVAPARVEIDVVPAVRREVVRESPDDEQRDHHGEGGARDALTRETPKRLCPVAPRPIHQHWARSLGSSPAMTTQPTNDE